MPSVPQTSVIFFALLVGFVVYITVKGELAMYLYVIGLEGGRKVSPTGTITIPSLPTIQY